MRKVILLFISINIFSFYIKAQNNSKTLDYYINCALNNSPLINEFKNKSVINGYELERLKSIYSKSRVEINADYLFVPIISKDNGSSEFKWNAQEANNYYGYDLSQVNGYSQGVVTWSKPLLGSKAIETAKEQTEINNNILTNNISMKKHDLKRSVTEQYLICLLYKKQIEYFKSLDEILKRQTDILKSLSKNGITKKSDIQLLEIESTNNQQAIISAKQSYRTHLLDLNILCGIKDTSSIELHEMTITARLPEINTQFLKQYNLDSLNAISYLKSFKVQYRPRLNLFVNGGIITTQYNNLQKRLGMSAGLSFAWLLYDGKQKSIIEKQTHIKLQSISTYRNEFINQIDLKRQKYLEEINAYEEKCNLAKKQTEQYQLLLKDYEKEMKLGELSVIDYTTTLRNSIQKQNEYMLLRANQQLLVNSFNYWNW